MPEVHIYVVEDELIHAEQTKLTIEDAGFLLAGESNHADEALNEIRKVQPDVVLMDISLPGKHNGISLAHALHDEHGPPVIFTTSFSDSETMQEAAKTMPVSYLIKPVDESHLKAAVTLALNSKTVEPQEKLRQEEGAIFIKSGNNLQKILIEDILWIESAGDNYCKVHTAKHQLVSRHTLKVMIRQLSSDRFVQTHRAYVVNRDKIDRVNEKEQSLIIDTHAIPIGRTFKEELYRQLRRL